MNLLSLAAVIADAPKEGASAGMGGLFTIGYFVIIIGIMYFIVIRPQKKQEQQRAAVLSTLEIGDSVLTTSGFYGIVIDIQDDMVIVEFGNNKNCRIPMQKAAIVEIEKVTQ